MVIDGKQIVLIKIPDGSEKGPKVKAEVEVKMSKKQQKKSKQEKK